MKIMQTCLDMLDSISGLVERSTTPVPAGIAQFQQIQHAAFGNRMQPGSNQAMFDHQMNDAPKKNFINHQVTNNQVNQNFVFK